MGLSWWHIVLVLLVFVLLFGGGKISALMGDVAKGLKSFKTGMAEDDEEERPEAKFIENKGGKLPSRSRRIASPTKGSQSRKSG